MLHTKLQPSGYYHMRGVNTGKDAAGAGQDASFHDSISKGFHSLHAAMMLHENGNPEAAGVHHQIAEHFRSNAALEHNHLSQGSTEQANSHRKSDLDNLSSHVFEVGSKTKDHELTKRFSKADGEPVTDFSHMIAGLHRSR